MIRLLFASGLVVLSGACAVEEGQTRPGAQDAQPQVIMHAGEIQAPGRLRYEPVYDARGAFSVVAMDSVSAYAEEPPSAPAPLS